MVLTFLLLVPLVAAIVLLAMPRTARLDIPVALGAAGVTAVLAVVAAIVRPVVDARWIRSLGIRWHFEANGLSVALILLTALLTVAAVLHTTSGPPPHGGSRSTMLGAVLLVETGALATFLARDAILFFIAFEVVLIPMWVLIRYFGDDHVRDEVRSDAASRFIFFTVLGSTMMLVGILLLVHHQGTSDLGALAAAGGAGLSKPLQVAIAALLVAGLGIKIPLWPVHTWLPSAHTIAPTVGSVLLAAILLKMGTYGIIRLAVGTVPTGMAVVSPYLAILGTVGILWGGLACLVERDLKRLIAYSSVAHMGFVALALASGSHTGLQAALLGNIAHGLVSALLFFLVGDLKEQWGSSDLSVARAALRDKSPRFGLSLVVGLAAALGLPGLVSFWGEFLALYAAWSPADDRPVALLRACVAAGAVGLALAAAYSLRVARIVWAGEGSEHAAAGSPAAEPVRDLAGTRYAVVAVLVAVIVLLGVIPHLLLGLSDLDAQTLLTAVRR